MNILQFIFPFLYTRNWHSGQKELSRPRVVLFFGMVSLIVFGVLIAFALQAPIEYSISA